MVDESFRRGRLKGLVVKCQMFLCGNLQGACCPFPGGAVSIPSPVASPLCAFCVPAVHDPGREHEPDSNSNTKSLRGRGQLYQHSHYFISTNPHASRDTCSFLPEPEGTILRHNPFCFNLETVVATWQTWPPQTPWEASCPTIYPRDI